MAGGEIFEASYTPGHNPEKPWEILDDKGNVLGSAATRNDGPSTPSPWSIKELYL